jgi:hypothetical protein
MHAASAPARLARAHHRFELRTLTHVGLDATNGGIVRNLTHAGIAMQAVSPPRAGDVMRVRIELRHPKLRMEFQGRVIWVTPTGQCGFRFLDATPRTTRQINQWIFGSLLDSSRHWTRAGSIFAEPEATTADDGLIVSQASPQVIRIEPAPQTEVLSTAATDVAELRHLHAVPDDPQDEPVEREWMSRPISARTLARTIDGLMVTASLLMVFLVFLSITHEFPGWPLNLEVAVGGVAFVLTFYWGFFRAFGGASLGTRLARLVDEEQMEPIEDADRFR